MNDIERPDLQRRHFVRTAAAAVAAGGGVLGLQTAAAATPDDEWHETVDIIVVGSGAAGCTAAVTAVSQGDSVMLIDKSAVSGGTTRLASGVAWVPDNAWLRAAGLRDEEADCLRYMARYAYPECYDADGETLGLDAERYALLLAFYRNGSAATELLQEVGAVQFTLFELPDDTGPSPDYASHLVENRTPKGRSIWPSPSSANGGRGAGLVDGMVDWLQQQGVALRLQHSLLDLETEQGRVSGVRVEHAGRQIRVRARKGVIVATGGFAHAPELLARHHRMAYGSCAMPTATGDFLPMAARVGAMQGELGTAWRTQVVLEEALRQRMVGGPVHIPPGDSMLMVNKHGRRVANEKRNYNDRSRVHYEWDPVAVEYSNQFLFLVFDQRAVDTFAGTPPLPREPGDSPHLIPGSSIADLATQVARRLSRIHQDHGIAFALGADFASNLAATIERFNGFAIQGVDEDFQRGAHASEREWQSHFSRVHVALESPMQQLPNPTMYPLDTAGPLYAVILAPGLLDTSGGPVIDAAARILGHSGQPIPGLFGAGNCVESPTREAYFGAGGTIGPAIAFGYIAARTAHSGDPGLAA